MTTPPLPSNDATRRAHELRLRILAALALAPVVLLVTWAGGAWFALMMLAAGVLMAREWVYIVHGGDKPQFLLHAVAGVSGVLAGLAAGLSGPGRIVMLEFAGAGLLAWVASLILTARARKGFTIHHVLGVPYIWMATFSLMVLRNTPECGTHAVFFLFAVIWAADSLAYFIGRALGGPKFAPRISPKKTWSGFFGAVTGGALAGLGYGLALGQGPWAALMSIGALLGGFEQFGDLFESAMKRRFGVKDSGALIPGHGGILDRVDGLAAAAMLALVIGALASGDIAQAGCGLFKWWGWP